MKTWRGTAVRGAQLVAVFAAIMLPLSSWAQANAPKPPAAEEKSAEDILNGLLGGSERGIGGVRTEQSANAPRPHIAVPIHFEYNSAHITGDSFAQLERVAQALKDTRLSGSRIGIEGHTDNQGSDAYNQTLSQRRADAVRQFLIDKSGIAVSRLIAKGYGKSQPLPDVSQETEEGRAANRRVEFVNWGTGPLPAAGAAQPLAVQVVVNYEKGGERRVLAPGGVLTPNDNYRVTFTPNRSSYVYVYQVDARGKATAVFPNPDYSDAANPVEGKRAYAVPARDQWLKLDQQPGEEEIVVLASENRLPDAMTLAQRMRNALPVDAVRGPAAGPRADVAPELPAGIFSYRLPFEHR